MQVHWKGDEMGSEEKKSVCEVCYKEFGSIKALYGHMRSHPDRPWRGIHSPISISSSSLSSIPSLSWSLTARRGRKGVGTSTAASSSSGSEAEPDPKANSPPNSDDRHQLFPNALIDELAQQKENNLSSPPVKKMKKMKELELKKDDEANLKQKKLYRCNRCGKAFLSHQALGGHKSSHYKAKIQSLHSDLIHSPQERRVFNFDLNELPPMEEDDDNNIGEAKQT